MEEKKFDNDSSKSIYEWYTTERARIVERKNEGSRSADSLILTLSSAGLGLSVTFLHDIVPATGPEAIWLIQVSWMSFSLAILSVLVSFLSSQKAFENQLSKFDEYYRTHKEPLWDTTWDEVTLYTNCISSTGFFLGLLFLTIFACINIV